MREKLLGTIAVGLAAVLQTGAAAITDGLVGHWRFDETSGGTAADSSGQKHNGALSAADPQWTSGKISGALTFRGEGNGDDYVVVPDFTKPTTTFSVSAWVIADPRDGTWPESVIVESGLASGGGPFGLVIRTKNRDQAFGPLGNTTTDADAAIAVNETVGFPVETWQHVGVVGDGTMIRLYRNGLEVAASNYTGTVAMPTSAVLGIGAVLDETGTLLGRYWQGKIDDVGIWTSALTPGQMASIFNAGQAGKDLTQADQYQNLPPNVTAHPASATRFAGETAEFSVKAAGTGTLTYQWKHNGQPIAGATSAVYRIASVVAADAGEYVVAVTNPGGTVNSQTATLTVKAADLSTGLIGYWKFDEKQGETAADSSTAKHSGMLNNYAGDNSQWVAGKIGGALQFGGPDLQQFVLVEDYAKPTSTLTISLWVYADQLATWSSFVKNWGSTDAGQFHFGIFGDGIHENIYIKQADGKTPNTSDADPFPTESWQHVAFVCDGSTVRLYRNGAEIASTPYDGSLVNPPMGCIGIGAKIANDCQAPDGGAPGWFQGKMDDVAIWNRGLSAKEMLAIYTAGQSGKGALEANVSQEVAPSISQQPAGGTFYEGKAVTLSVTATGTEPLSYQWFKADSAIGGATNRSLALGAATSALAGKYTVKVANGAGSIVSEAANLTVSAWPTAKLIAEWKFEDNLKDTSGNSNDGTAQGAVEYVAGVSGKAVRLAPANPIVNEAANNLPAKGVDSWSINLWLNLSEAPKSLAYLAGFGPVKDQGAGTPRSLLAFGGTGNNNVYAWGSNRDTSTGVPYPIGKWCMVTIVHEGTDLSPDGTTTLYLDGEAIGENQQPRVDIPEGYLQISLAATSHWNIDVGGSFDEFTLWQGALSPARVRELFGGEAAKLTATLAGSKVTLSWASSLTGYTLESADRLPSATWTPVAGVQGNTVTVSADAGNRFYRLRK